MSSTKPPCGLVDDEDNDDRDHDNVCVCLSMNVPFLGTSVPLRSTGRLQGDWDEG